MASPLSRKIIAGAIGESGAFFGETLGAASLSDAEKNGESFMKQVKASSLADLRAMKADALLKAMSANPFRFGVCIDGYFFPKAPKSIFVTGEQAKVPLLAGWNGEEMNAGAVMGGTKPSGESFNKAVQRLYGENAELVLKGYKAMTDEEAQEMAAGLASDRFIGYGTWKWLEVHGKNSGKATYRYLFTQPKPGQKVAHHADEIDYCMGNLHLSPNVHWTDDDKRASATMFGYFANFIKTGNPNGSGLPEWPVNNGRSGPIVMEIAGKSSSTASKVEPCYQALDSLVKI